MHDELPQTRRVIVSYLTLRRVIGVLGCALPVVVYAWGKFAAGTCSVLQESISHYYDCEPRDAFVGILFAIALFLFTYRGYDWRDEVAGTIAAVSALGVALFPHAKSEFTGIVHYVSAGVLLLTLAIFTFFLFTISSGEPTREKRLRNLLYRVCGIAIVVCMATIGAVQLFGSDAVKANGTVFWLESIALWAFGASWLVKGDTVLRDLAHGGTDEEGGGRAEERGN